MERCSLLSYRWSFYYLTPPFFTLASKYSKGMSQFSPRIYDMDSVIRTINISKIFTLKESNKTMFSTLRKRLSNGAFNSKTFFALNDINIEVSKGEKIGIVGNNGSGKTTLLKTIAGLYKPDKGELYVNGDMILLSGLGVGMLDELSVRENIFLYGAIYGMDRQTTKEKFGEILAWAEVQDFVEAKLKTLSSGMRSRLAFSALRHVETDIFLLDEAFSGGDKNFKKKYEEVFENHKNSEKTFLIATHDLNFARMFCTKTLWIHKGKQMAFGETEEVLQQYIESKPA
jgi:ABC-type polysaccharide/polyol phosphate transport system ATPase subunit